jgi:hypothetical protein
MICQSALAFGQLGAGDIGAGECAPGEGHYAATALGGSAKVQGLAQRGF